MRVLVCGGRDYAYYTTVASVLREIKPTVIIHGGARGADYLASVWAVTHNIPEHPYPADWNKHGKAAGPIRNQQMLDEGQPDLVIAFPGGRGTADMVKRAKKAGITVREL